MWLVKFHKDVSQFDSTYFRGYSILERKGFFRKHPCEVAVFQVGHARAERARCHGGVAPRTFEVVRFLGRCMCQ